MTFHGWGKIREPFSWMGPDAATPGFLQALAAISEFGGGIALVLGLLTPLAMLGWICTMGVAIYTLQSKGATWLNPDPKGFTFELAALYFGVAVLFLLAGPGRYSLDHLILSRRGPKGQIRAGTV